MNPSLAFLSLSLALLLAITAATMLLSLSQ